MSRQQVFFLLKLSQGFNIIIQQFDPLINQSKSMSTKSKYIRVKAPQEAKEEKLDTDIIMRFSDKYGKYVGRALTLLFGENKKTVNIRAAEKLMDRALWVAEVVRRKVEGLHQIIHISEKKVVDIYQPKQEGLDEVRQERFMTTIDITLTKEPTAQQKKASGYQAPIKGEGDFVTKQQWEKGENERKERREQRPERNNRDNRDNRRDNREDRGEERKRGRY